MKYDISGNPAYGDLTVALEPGESFWSEGGAMSRMSSGLDLNTQLPAGLLKSVLRRLVGGESLFVSEYTARAEMWRNPQRVSQFGWRLRAETQVIEGHEWQRFS